MMHLSAPTVGLLVGAAILLLGRKLFWLFVAAMGFVLGAQIATQVTREPVLVLLVAIGLGILGAVLAYLFQKVAIGLVGFFAGGRVALALAAAFFAQYAKSSQIIFIIGGILGVIVFLALFDWALIFFSSIEGARLIGNAIILPHTGHVVLFIGLAVIGILVQSSMLSPARRPK